MHHLRDTSFPMIDIKSGVEKLFKIVGHSGQIDFKKYDSDVDTFYETCLAELRILENSFNKI